MNKSTVTRMTHIYIKKIEKARKDLLNAIEQLNTFIDGGMMDDNSYEVDKNHTLSINEVRNRLKSLYYCDFIKRCDVYLEPIKSFYTDIPNDLFKTICNCLETINGLGIDKPISKTIYSDILDDDPMYFHGDIIITDPCYLYPDMNWDEFEEKEDEMRTKYNYEALIDSITDWEEIENWDIRRLTFSYPNPVPFKQKDSIFPKYLYSKTLEKVYKEYQEKINDWYDTNGRISDLSQCNLSQYISRPTLYGDWGCNVFDMNSEDKHSVGEFCADGGMVCVCYVDEIKKLCGEQKLIDLENSGSACIIRDFDGYVWGEVKKHTFTYNKKKCVDYDLKFHIDGINYINKEKINYITSQTSL